MWTDTFQMVCMFGSFIAIVAKGSIDVGGSGKVFSLNYETDRIELFK